MVEHVEANTQVLAEPHTQAIVRLRVEYFDLITRVLGCESDAARGQLLDVHPKTIGRAKGGQVGEVFIAQAVFNLRKHADTLGQYGLTVSFEDLFEVVGPEPGDG